MIWCCLIGFGLISLAPPAWLQAISSGGKTTEARGFVGNGDQLARQGDWRGAVAWYDRALLIEPDNTAAIVNRAIACGRLGLVEEGLRTLREALAQNPESRWSILYNLAELNRQKGDLTQAAADYGEALAAGAAPELVQARLGEIHARRGETAAARDALRAALRAREDPAAHYRRAFVTVQTSDDLDAEARRAIESVLQGEITAEELTRFDLEFVRDQALRDPERGRLLGQLGEVESAAGDRSAAIEHLRESLRIWPSNPEAAALQGLLERLTSGGSGG